MILRLVCGVTTIDLVDESGFPRIHGRNPYTPLEPQMSFVDSTDLGEDGAERRVITYRNVTEQFPVVLHVDPASPDDFEALVSSLDQFFLSAEMRSESGIGDRCYLEFQPDNYPVSEVWRSEILSGKHAEHGNATGKAWARGRVDDVLTWTRRYYFERNDLVEIPLATRSAAKATGGVQVDNYNDGVVAESAGVATGGATEGGTLASVPVDPGTVVIHMTRVSPWGAVTLSDDGAGHLLFRGNIVGAINYATGVWSVTWVLNEIVATGNGTDTIFSGLLNNTHVFSTTYYITCGIPAHTSAPVHVANLGAYNWWEVVEHVLGGGIALADQTWQTYFDMAIDNGGAIWLTYSQLEPCVASSAITVDYCKGKFNTVDVAAVDVIGSRPAPVRLYILNDDDSETHDYRHFYVGQNVRSNPAAFSHNLEGESAASGGSTQACATCSGGSYRQFTWVSTAEYELGTWLLNKANLALAGGNRFRVLMRTHSLSGADMFVRLKLMDYSGVSAVWVGNLVAVPLVTGGDALYDLGVVRLPPNFSNAAYSHDLVLRLSGYKNASGTHEVDVDFFQFVPLDGWRSYSLIGSTWIVGYQAGVHDDPYSGDVWLGYGESGILGATAFVARGAPLMVYPGRAQRFYFLHDDADPNRGNMAIYGPTRVRMYYRPRKLTL